MTKKFLLGTGLLIALYIAVANATGFGKAITSTAGAYSTGVKTLQGR